MIAIAFSDSNCGVDIEKVRLREFESMINTNSCVIHFRNHERIRFEELIEWQIKEGIDAIVVAGTTGESPTLTHEEEYELLYSVCSLFETLLFLSLY